MWACVHRGDWKESERLKEHRYTVKKENLKNVFAAHTCQQQHSVDWDAAKVRCTEQHYWKRKAHEAIHISQQCNTSNLDCGFQINPVWLSLIQKPLQRDPALFVYFYSPLLHSISCLLLFFHHFNFSPHLPLSFYPHKDYYLSHLCFWLCSEQLMRPSGQRFCNFNEVYAMKGWVNLPSTHM